MRGFFEVINGEPFEQFPRRMLFPLSGVCVLLPLYRQIDLQRPNKSGTADNYIIISGYPGETVTLQYADSIKKSYGPIKARGSRGYFIFENMMLDGSNSTNLSSWSIRDGNHHFILRNLEIKNFRHPGLYISANDIQVMKCTIHDQVSVSRQPGERHDGIYFHDGINTVIEGNEIYNNPGYCSRP